MARSNSPTAVATYETKLIDKKELTRRMIQLRSAFKKEE